MKYFVKKVCQILHVHFSTRFVKTKIHKIFPRSSSFRYHSNSVVIPKTNVDIQFETQIFNLKIKNIYFCYDFFNVNFSKSLANLTLFLFENF